MGNSPGSRKSPYFLQDKLAENYYRLCGLITTVCTDLLRDILSRHIKPSDLRFELDINRTKLEKHMTKVQREHFYLKAGSNPIFPKDLDVSILYMLLRNICNNIPKPKTGWGNPPLIGDNSISACIERIRQVRNKIHAHSTNGRVNDTDFQNYWDELYVSVIGAEKELTGGSVYESDMRNLLSMTLSQTDGKKYNYEFHKSKGLEEQDKDDKAKEKNHRVLTVPANSMRDVTEQTCRKELIFETFYHKSGKEFQCRYFDGMRFYLSDWGTKEWQPFPKRWYKEGLFMTKSMGKNHGNTCRKDVIIETFYHKSGKEFQCIYSDGGRFYLDDRGSKVWRLFPKRWYNKGLFITNSVVKGQENGKKEEEEQIREYVTSVAEEQKPTLQRKQFLKTCRKDVIFETFYHKSGKEFQCIYFDGGRFYLDDRGPKVWRLFPGRWHNSGLLITNSVVKGQENGKKEEEEQIREFVTSVAEEQKPTLQRKQSLKGDIADKQQLQSECATIKQDDREGVLNHTQKRPV